MLPDQPWYVKCPHCQTLLWIDEIEVVGEVDPFSKDKADENTKPFCTPDLNDFYSTLASGNLNKQKEHYIRLRVWWAENDKRRDAKTMEAFSENEKNNLQLLTQFLDDSDDNNRLMRAEIKRELGEFEAAESILSEPFDEALSKAVTIIRDLVQERNSFVAKMNFEQ